MSVINLSIICRLFKGFDYSSEMEFGSEYAFVGADEEESLQDNIHGTTAAAVANAIAMPTDSDGTGGNQDGEVSHLMFH